MSRAESREKFLNALEELLLEDGELGINSLAEKAGLNKVLIYRYFGGWDGVLEEYAGRLSLWRDIRKEVEKGLEEDRWAGRKEAVGWIFKSYTQMLLTSPGALRILKEELWKPGPLSRKLEKEREEEGVRLTALLQQAFGKGVSPAGSESDWNAAGAFITAGLTYLLLKSTLVKDFNGIDISSKEGWDRVTRIWEGIIY